MSKRSVINFFLIVIFILKAFVFTSSQAMNFQEPPEWIQNFAHAINNDAERLRRENIHTRQNISHQIALLQHNGVDENDARIQEYRRQIKSMDAAEEFGMSVLGGARDVIFGEMNSARKIREESRIAAVKGTVKNKGSLERIKFAVEQLKDPQNLTKLILTLSAATLGIAGAYYGTKLLYQYVETNMSRPNLVLESSRGSLWLHLKQSLGFNLPIDAKLTDIILAPEIEKEVYALADDTKIVQEYNLTFENMLFYGPPGTGKTAFAKTISHYADMDYAIIPASNFDQFNGGDKIIELNKLFDWAESSDRGTILFFDECDSILRDRSALDDNGIKLVNSFIARTGDSSKKFMIILATNYEDELDSAVRSRIHKKLKFGLPAEEERFKIVTKKIEKYIIDDEHEIKQNDGSTTICKLTFSNEVNESYLRDIAKRIEGFSGRDIDQLIANVRLSTYRSGKLEVTKEIFDYVVDMKKKQIEKDKQTSEYQRARAQKKCGTI